MARAGPVIIVEDDLEDQEIYAYFFKELKCTHEVKFFEEGQALLHYLRTTTDQPFIIITDINLSEMDGIQLRNEVCKDDFLKQKSIPFVFLTTSNGKHVLKRVYDMQVQGFF
ncbi:MAG: response regulator, partial [Flavisolibacter sp.]|nr:response regulator [Flavisolibacter sp.]